MIRIHSCDSNLQRRDILASGHLQKNTRLKLLYSEVGWGWLVAKFFFVSTKVLGEM